MGIKVFKKTNDDWYGNYKLVDDSNLVEVSLTQTGPNPKKGKGEFRVCVWGNDDCGMELDFGVVENAAMAMFMKVLSMETVEKYKLKELGFISA